MPLVDKIKIWHKQEDKIGWSTFGRSYRIEEINPKRLPRYGSL